MAFTAFTAFMAMECQISALNLPISNEASTPTFEAVEPREIIGPTKGYNVIRGVARHV